VGLPPLHPAQSETRPALGVLASFRAELDSDTRPGVAVASYHIQINTGGKGEAGEHSMYIQREGRFTEEKYGAVAARGQANMPEWAREEPGAFWKASDAYERANGNTYREYELALPRELSRAEQVALVQRFAEQELGSTRPYQWAIHTPMARDGREQPHVHLMFSDRQLDGIERGPAQFFKRYNAKAPERGGCRKATYGVDKEEAARVYEEIRERWAKVQNLALERAGEKVRVDHRSLAAQGIRDREPELHRGPAVSGIEARSQVSQVGARQREQRQERAMAREAVVAEVRVVTRQEVAAERVAVRERRELAREVTGPEREMVLPRVEADRREQIERASAAAERRVERRQGMGIGGRLLEQARGLRERIGQQLGRVREWIVERFPDPLQQLKERSREVFDVVVEKAQRAMGRDAAEALGAAKTAERQRGMFDGLHLKTGTRTPERGAFAEVRLPAQERTPETARDVAQNLNRALDRYARAWSDAARMQEKNLSILEHQKTALREAGAALDGVRPGASSDLQRALEYEPAAHQAMTHLQGRERTVQLLAALDHEGRVRADPNLKAERLVKVWNGLEAERERLSGYERKSEREQIKARMQALAGELKRDPQLESVLQRRQQELGIARGSRLDRVMREPDIERALALSVRDLGRHRGLGLSR
jgi:hypothetical protein